MVCSVPEMATNASAQEIRGGVEVGLNVSRPGFGESSSASNGFHVGVKGELGLKSATIGWFVDGAVRLTSKPFRGKVGYADYSGWGYQGRFFSQYSNIPYYLEFPFHVGYKIRVHDNVTIYPAIGPYLSVGLFGKSRWMMMDAGNGDIWYDHPGNPFKKGAGNKRVDAGAGLTLGAEFFRHFQFNLGYQIGFVEFDGRYNQVLSVGAAWMF